MTRTLAATLLLVVLAASISSQPLTIRMNCGSPLPYASPGGGPPWEPERPYNPLDPFPAGYVGGAAQPGLGVQLIGGTRDAALFRDARRGMTAWRFNVPAGSYAVRLGLAETEHHGPGFRVFSCTLEGVPAFTDLDLLAEHTRDYATTRRYLATVTDGVLDFEHFLI